MRFSALIVAALLMYFTCLPTAISAQACGGATISSLQFDGANDVVRIPNPGSSALDGFTDFTIECWFRINAGATAFPTLVSKWRQNSQTAYLLRYNTSSNSVEFYFSNAGAALSFASTAWADGSWHHVAVTRSGSTVTMYKDGAQVATTANGVSMISMTAPLMFGCFNAANDVPQPATFMNGAIDEVRIWNVARTAAEMQLYYIVALSGLEAGLVGYWRLDDALSSAAAQTVVDLSPTGAGGTRGGSSAAAADDPSWSLTDAPALSYAGSGLTGNPNSTSARLEINGQGTGTTQGPFIVTVTSPSTLTFAWSGEPNQPLILAAGVLNVANTVSPLIGTLDIGSPCAVPAYSDIAIVFDGTLPPYSLFFRTDGTGTATQSFTLPSGLPSGGLINVQGIMGTTTGVGLYLTAAFRIQI